MRAWDPALTLTAMVIPEYAVLLPRTRNTGSPAVARKRPAAAGLQPASIASIAAHLVVPDLACIRRRARSTPYCNRREHPLLLGTPHWAGV